MAGIQEVEEVKEKRSKGCRNPRSGDPRGSRNPRGQVLKSGRNSKGGALPAAREFRISRADFAFPSVILPFRARVLPFSAQAESVSPPSFVFPSRLRLSPRKLNLSPCAFRRMRVFYVFFGGLSRNFIFFIFMSE